MSSFKFLKIALKDFITYQNTPMLLKTLKNIFSETRWFFEPRNFLPYFILIGKK